METRLSASRILCVALLACSLMLNDNGLNGYLEAVKLDVRPGDASGWQIVRITYRDRADLERLAAWLDVWEVHPELDLVVARVGLAEYQQLLRAGYPVTIDAARSLEPSVAPGLCYRTVDQLYADQDLIASTYPTLTQVITIGTSYEGRPLLVLKLTNTTHDLLALPKPRFFLMADIHGREFITPEAAMQFIKQLLEGYGHDAELTWLLDWREIYVLVTANPDGHAHNELTYTYWRKNADPANQSACPSDYGTDLNRNSSFQWGSAGASTFICDETYRGAAPASELETQAIQNYVASLFPNQRGPLIADSAPMTTTGILISLHSYSNLVLWPWGFEYDVAPNNAQLAQLGQKLAGFNGYAPEQASGLYLTSGSTDDWSYGTLGIASYTFEMGSSLDGFLPDCTSYDTLIQPNLDALIYAAEVARAPYQNSPGPDAVSLTTATLSDTVMVTVTITSGQVVSAAQVYLDTPPWESGAPLPLPAADGTFDQATEVVTATLPRSSLSFGRHTVFVRGQDVLGNWGAVSWASFDLSLPYSNYFPFVARN